MGERTRVKAPEVHPDDDFTMAGLNLDGFSNLRGLPVNLDLTGQCSLNVSGTGRINSQVPTDIDVPTSDALVVRDGVDECLRVDMFNHKVTICATDVKGPFQTFNTNILGGTLTCIESDEFQVHDKVITLNKNQIAPLGVPAGIDIKIGNGIGDNYIGLQWNGTPLVKRWEIQVDGTDPISFKPIAYTNPLVNDGNLASTTAFAGSRTIGTITGSLPNIDPPGDDLQTVLEAIDFATGPPIWGSYFLGVTEITTNELNLSTHLPDEGSAIDLASMSDSEFLNNIYIYSDGLKLLNQSDQMTDPTDALFANDIARKVGNPNVIVFNDEINLCAGIIIQIIDHNVKKI